MTKYNDCITLMLDDGRVIICQSNGYTVRTIESGFGSNVTDSHNNHYGAQYWVDQAKKDLNIIATNIMMKIYGKVLFKN